MKTVERIQKFIKAWLEKIFLILLERTNELKEEYPVLKKYLKVPGFVKKIKPLTEKIKLSIIDFINKLKKKYPVLEKYLVLPETGKKRAVICRILAAVIVFVSVFGIGGAITRGERINVKKAVAEYNESAPDTSSLYKNATKEQIHERIDDLDSLAAAQIAQVDIESVLYTDETVTLIGKLLGEYTDKDFDEVKFKTLKKNYPDAYDYVTALQDDNKDWEELETVPFGIAKGDKEAFVKACGAFAEFLGNDMISIFMEAPSIYNDALVPAFEALHTGKMPTLASFVMKTGLSGSARVEFIIEKVLSIIEPIKEAPVTYLCEMLPDFIINYTRASEFVNDKDIDLELPEIEDILDSVWKMLDMTYKPLDLEYLSSLGTAQIAESGGNKGKRVEIIGDRDAVFLYIADYVLFHLTYENNYPSVEKLLTTTLKEIDRTGEIGKLIYSDGMNKIAACFIDIVALNKVKTTNTDAQTLVNQHNARGTDFEAVFSGLMSRERVSGIISTLDSVLSSYLKDGSIENILFTDTVATTFTKLASSLCSIEFSDIPFDAMKYSFPEAYSYLKALQAEGKTWDEVDFIPFGIEAGDQATFIKACGAGAEYLGDLLALNMLISPTIYDEALVVLTEALHLGTSPDVREFIDMHGLDGAKRIEIILELVLPMLEPLKEAPVSYLCTILPELIYALKVTSDCAAANPGMALTGIEFLPLDQLIAKLLGEFGVAVPDYDFDQIIALSTAEVAESGDRTGKKMELTGDKEAVFAALISYVSGILSQENNIDALSNAASELLGINAVVIKPVLSMFKSILG